MKLAINTLTCDSPKNVISFTLASSTKKISMTQSKLKTLLKNHFLKIYMKWVKKKWVILFLFFGSSTTTILFASFESWLLHLLHCVLLMLPVSIHCKYIYPNFISSFLSQLSRQFWYLVTKKLSVTLKLKTLLKNIS